MRSLGARAAMLAVPWIAACGGSAIEAPQPSAPEDPCPYRTPDQWQSFLEREAADPRWTRTCEDEPCDEGDFRRVERDVVGTLRLCGGYLRSHPAIERCTKNLGDFALTYLDQHAPDTYGFTVDNPTYLAGQEGPDEPAAMMAPPADLVRALPTRSGVEAAARRHGWKYLTHDSALGGIRTFIYIPDPKGRFDQWMLLNFPMKGQRSIDPATPISFIAVQKQDARGNALPRIRLHFRDYDTIPTSRGFRIEPAVERNGKCYSCHPSGMRALIPARGQVLEAEPVRGEEKSSRRPAAGFAEQRLVELNARLASYGLPDWGGLIAPERHGPPLGAEEGCTACHDGTTRGVLTVSTSSRQVAQKAVAELAMPPDGGLTDLLARSARKDPPLTAQEARRLEEARAKHAEIDAAFEASRLPELERWLLEHHCR